MESIDLTREKERQEETGAPEGGAKKRKKKFSQDDTVFYYAVLAWPILQFIVFYVLTRVNAVLYSFQTYDVLTNTVTWTFSHVENAFRLMTSELEYTSMMGATLKFFFFFLGIGTPLGLLFAYYVRKKMFASGAFRVLLFLPSIISAIVMATIYQFFVERALPEIVYEIFGVRIKGLMENPDTRFGTIVFYNIWVGFGVNVLMYTNAMSGISSEVLESARLDGATGIREFWFIALPLIYPTVTTFLITSFATLFTNQFNIYSFYGGSVPAGIGTFGYYLFNATEQASSRAEYSIISAIGLLLTCIALPLTLFVRWLLNKFDPTEDGAQ